VSHPTETLILSLKQETPPFHPNFSKILYQAFQPHLEKFWYTEERIPLLGEVRGRGMLLTRFDRDGNGGVEEGGWGEGLGIHPYTWPDSRKEGFEWFCGDVTVRTQDWWVLIIGSCYSRGIDGVVGIESRRSSRYLRNLRRYVQLSGTKA
jgi:1-phosphatidylinositol phosphodiesterase